MRSRYADGGEDDLTARLQQVLRALKKQAISRWFLAPVTEEAPTAADSISVGVLQRFRAYHIGTMYFLLRRYM